LSVAATVTVRVPAVWGVKLKTRVQAAFGAREVVVAVQVLAEVWVKAVVAPVRT
jgi:hypothetical protein